MLIAFDIDGTLADLTHRLHFIKREDGTKDWDSFFKACKDDEPIVEMIDLCHDLIYGHNDIIFVSGRSDSVREATVEWLNDYLHMSSANINNHLYMRSEGDHRPDYQIKRELLVRIMADYGQKPDIVFDDRQQVVDMFRAEGIRVCQVAKGLF